MSKPSINHPIGRIRLIGLLEGISYVVLLGIAVPLKYMAEMPMAVKITGPIHGGLWVLLMLLAAAAWGSKALSTKDCALVVLASLLPFGPFVIDRRLAKDESGS